MILFWIILICLLFIYSITFISLAIGWCKIPTSNIFKPNNNSFVQISVIIAVRNEEQNISQLLTSLKAQSYPTESFEVIIVDDYSEDNTFNLINEFIKDLENYHLLKSSSATCGKKAALTMGLEASSGELIVFTDADCILKKTWLEYYNSHYQSESKPDMIIGLVDIFPTKSFLQELFRLDFLSLIISSGGAFQLGYPIFNNSANLAIKKAALNGSLNFRTDLASGDDVFLLHDFKARNKRISLLKSSDHTVCTLPPVNLTEFIQQRRRWASKASKYSDRDIIKIAMLVLSSNTFFLVTYALIPVYNTLTPLVVFYTLKTTIDISVFLSAKTFFRLNWNLLLIPLIELIYPFYIFYTAFNSIKKPFQWKGRIIEK